MRANYAELQNAYAAYCTSNLPPVTPRPRPGITDLDRKLARNDAPRTEYEAWRAMAEPVARIDPYLGASQATDPDWE